MKHTRADEIARLYLAGKSVREIADALNMPWPQVHVIVFDLKREGVLPRASERRAA